MKSSICVTAVFNMQYWEAEIWIMAEYMKTSFASSFFAVDMMFMSASSTKRKSTLLLREATRSFIFRSATTFPGSKHLRENAFLGFRFEMLPLYLSKLWRDLSFKLLYTLSPDGRSYHDLSGF